MSWPFSITYVGGNYGLAGKKIKLAIRDNDAMAVQTPRRIGNFELMHSSYRF